MPDVGQDQRSLMSGSVREGFFDGLLGLVGRRIDQEAVRCGRRGAIPDLGVDHDPEEVLRNLGEERQRRLDGLALRADDQDIMSLAQR